MSFNPKIFDAETLCEPVPEGFNAVMVPLDGKVQADLDWDREKEVAAHYRQQGYKIFWDMDLGFLSQLKRPITNESQFLSLGLSLDHFRDTLWDVFKEDSVGICLYRGSLDFNVSFPWNAEQRELFEEHYREENPFFLNLYCRDVVMEYLNMLGYRLPEELPKFLLLDASHYEKPFEEAYMLSKANLQDLRCAIKGGNLPLSDLSWGEGGAFGYIGRTLHLIETQEISPVGIYLPNLKNLESTGCLSEVMASLDSYRVIPEEVLTTEWEGLDYLIVDPATVSAQGIRKLHGFCAAGGTIVTTGDPLQVAKEVSFKDWSSN